MRAMLILRVLVAAMLIGCAGATTQSRSERGSGNLLTQQQLAATNSDNLYDAIAKLRPDWLTSRGPSSVSDPTPSAVSVFMNGTLLGKVDYLREMRLLDASEVRYWDAGSASARFGMGHSRGVIEITRK